MRLSLSNQTLSATDAANAQSTQNWPRTIYGVRYSPQIILVPLKHKYVVLIKRLLGFF